MKRIVSLALAMLLVLTLFAGVSFTSAEEAPPVVNWMYNGANTVTDDNMVINEVRKITGIDLHCNYISSGDYNTKLNTLIAADTLPDLFNTSGQTALDLRDAGKIIDYSALLPEYGPDILAAYNGELENLTVNKEGGVYGLVNLSAAIIENLIIR